MKAGIDLEEAFGGRVPIVVRIDEGFLVDDDEQIIVGTITALVVLDRNMKQIVATSLRQSLCVLHNVHDFLHKQPMSEGSPGTQRGSD